MQDSQVGALRFIPGDETVGEDGDVLLTRTATGLQISVDGAAAIPLEAGGESAVITAAPVSGDGTVLTPITIAAGALTNETLALMAAHTYKGNNTGSEAAADDITATELTADLNPATALLQGMMSPQDKAGQFRPHASTLTDANATIAPGSLKIGKAILPAGTLTGNRVLKLLDTGVHTTQLFQVVCLDVSANTYTITDSADTPIATKGASQGAPITFQFYHNGSLWTTNTSWWST